MTSLLFEKLKDSQYTWFALTPDLLLEARAKSQGFRPLVRLFGLGMPLSKSEFEEEGWEENFVYQLKSRGFLEETTGTWRATRGICGDPSLYIFHDHWPPNATDSERYVHAGAESFTFSDLLLERIEKFDGKSVVDLGCSSGILSFKLGHVANKVVGIDPCSRAVEWAEETKIAYHFQNVRFFSEEVGKPSLFHILEKGSWDAVIFNPPMVISETTSYRHRDGGKYGIELPLKFIATGLELLNENGRIYCLVTNPIVDGRSLFFEELRKQKGVRIEKEKRIHSHFNQSVARKQGYSKIGVSKVELWYLELRRE